MMLPKPGSGRASAGYELGTGGIGGPDPNGTLGGGGVGGGTGPPGGMTGGPDLAGPAVAPRFPPVEPTGGAPSGFWE